ncbi:penicillin-binding protein 2 [candidate division WOR-3 bacterium]|nr:penicillin-binding protein 2 [candidate division WOR-3 bacterium]
MRQPISRTKVLIAVAAAVWSGLLFFLGYIQLGRWKHYEREAMGQQGETLDLHATRGRVYDAAGRPLTLNRSCCSIRILPQWARDKDMLAGILAQFGLAERRTIAREIRRRDRLFWFRRDVDYAVGDSLRRVLVERQFSNCTYVEDEYARVYPHGELCANVVGFTGDGRGRAGIEFEYDSVLRGRGGWVQLQKDAIGRAFPYPSFPTKRPVPGLDIHLTLDLDVQQVCYDALKQRVAACGALGGSAIVLDATRGSILGLADYPGYDPMRFAAYPAETYKSAALSDQFEPGSSFKLVACAAALESPDADRLTRETFDVSSGFIEVGKYKIHDVHKNGVLDFPGLFIKSSNPGCVLLSLQLDPEKFYELARALGFGNAVGVGLPNEGSGRIDPPRRLNRLRFANVVFGQGVTVTLLQLAAAYLCVANDGAYLRPYLIESVRQPQAANSIRQASLSGFLSGLRSARATVKQFSPSRLRQAIRPETARRMKDILERVVTEGTGELARIDGVSVCGKTGTAQKVEPGGGYSKTRSRMTFVGFFPKEKPRYVIAVLVDEPKTERFAHTTTCPVFRQIGEDLILLERMRSREADRFAESRGRGVRG